MPRVVLHLAFFASGFAAVLYQLIWQRVLLGLYGADIESVTVVVAAFMAGLGAGSLVGGWIADRTRWPLWVIFGAIELAIAICGVSSIAVFRAVGALTVAVNPGTAWSLIAVLLFVPTALMGATLPVLTAHVARATGGVGHALGWLYGVNTLGSAAGAVATVAFVAAAFGQQGSVQLAAACNLAAAGAVFASRPAS